MREPLETGLKTWQVNSKTFVTRFLATGFIVASYNYDRNEQGSFFNRNIGCVKNNMIASHIIRKIFRIKLTLLSYSTKIRISTFM